MSSENNYDFYCYCSHLIDELIHFYREISSIKSERLKWQKFREFTIRFPTRFSRINCDTCRSYIRMPCEQNIYIGLYKVFTQKNSALSTLLLNVIEFYYCKKIHFDINDFESYLEDYEIFGGNDNVRLVLTALHGNPTFTKLLLDFDLLNLDGETFPLMFVACRILEELVLMVAGVSVRDSESKAIESLHLAIKVFFPYMYEEQMKRICLTTFGIQVILLKMKNQEKEANDCLHCLRMYFAGTRDPFITRNEVRGMLYTCLTVLKTCKVLPEDHHGTLEMYYDEFVKLMPHSPAKLKPRNLTDLTRCEIRKNLKNCNLTLPAAVKKLRLSQLLKDFILGDVLYLSRTTGNVSMEEIITIPQLADLLFKIYRPKMVLVSPIRS